MKSIRKSMWGMYWKLHDKRKRLAASLKGYLDGLPPENHAAASCWGCSPPSRCLPFTPSAEPSMTSAGTTAHIWKRDTPDGWNCRPRGNRQSLNTLFIWNRQRMNRRKRTKLLPKRGTEKGARTADRGATAETAEDDRAARYGVGVHRGDVADIRPVLRQGASAGNGSDTTPRCPTLTRRTGRLSATS